MKLLSACATKYHSAREMVADSDNPKKALCNWTEPPYRANYYVVNAIQNCGCIGAPGIEMYGPTPCQRCMHKIAGHSVWCRLAVMRPSCYLYESSPKVRKPWVELLDAGNIARNEGRRLSCSTDRVATKNKFTRATHLLCGLQPADLTWIQPPQCHRGFHQFRF